VARTGLRSTLPEPETARQRRPRRPSTGLREGDGFRMQNEIIINAERGETRVAVLERSSFSELYIERDGDTNVVGSVV